MHVIMPGTTLILWKAFRNVSNLSKIRILVFQGANFYLQILSTYLLNTTRKHTHKVKHTHTHSLHNVPCMPAVWVLWIHPDRWDMLFHAAAGPLLLACCQNSARPQHNTGFISRGQDTSQLFFFKQILQSHSVAFYHFLIHCRGNMIWYTGFELTS